MDVVSSSHLLGPWLLAVVVDASDPLAPAPDAQLGASTGSDTGTQSTGASTETTTGTTGVTTGPSTTGAGTQADTDAGTSAGTDASSSSATTDSASTTDGASGSATTTSPTMTDDGGSFVDGDITGVSFGPEDFMDEDGCITEDDADLGCCDHEDNNSDNFCHISRHGRDRVAIAVLLILLARPRRARR